MHINAKIVILLMKKINNSILSILFLTTLFGIQDSDIIVPGFDCGDCHGSGGWDRLTLTGFNHSTTEFPLKGIHKIQNCSSCHLGETNTEKHQFQKDNSDCISCHIDIHKSELGDNCLQCHTEQTWTVNSQSFDHNQTQFPLLNGHKNVLCNQCHFGESSSQFTATPTDCYSCHITDFSSTGTIQYPESPNHSSLNYSQDCSSCHTTNKWQDAIFNHDETNFSLKNAHNKTPCLSCHANGEYFLPLSCDGCHVADGIAETNSLTSTYDHESHQINENCESCHTSTIWSSLIFEHLNFSSQNCEVCHLPEHTDSQDPPHAYENINTDCQLCHATSSNWDIFLFAHSETQTGYLLEGAHENTNCTSCHLNNVFASTPQDCWSCHASDYEATGNETFPNAPDHQALSYGQSCIVCHSMEQWTGAIFDHNQTEFPLLGTHETTDCQTCHANNNYDLPLSCDGCHVIDGVATSNSTESSYDHATHQINADCETCHTADVWSNLIFDHLNFSNQNCEECHLPEYNNSVEPPHGNDNIGTDCQICHNTTANWDISPFAHSETQTGYLLEGAHENTDCSSCHLNNVFASTPQDCWSCHASEYDKTGTSNYPNSPNHNDLSYSQSCNICHSTDQWLGAEFDHNETNFPLVDSHASLNCETCHANNNYDLPLSCDGCHVIDGVATSNSTESSYDHATHQINADCETCHTADVWSNLIFDHLNFSNQNCEECHLPEHINSENPPHGNENIQDDCELCHTSTSTWLIENFLHSSTQTDFELTGLHIPAECTSCHVNQIFNSTPTSCENTICHLNDFNSTTDPNHADYGFPVGYCSHCHETLGWEPDIFSHTVENACATCHLPDYNSADEPPHTGLPTSCEDCHTSTTTWEGATFTHSGIIEGCNTCHMNDFYEEHNDGDPTNCEACHTTEDWEDVNFSHDGVTDGCISCHLNDFEDDHDDGDPTNCEACHTTDDWDDITFDHDDDYFPIYSGDHEDEWTTCSAECHIAPDDFSQFSCGLNGVCHDHIQSEMDDEHDDEDDYVYESSACFNCHPNGTEDDDDDLFRSPFKQKSDFMKKFPIYIPK